MLPGLPASPARGATDAMPLGARPAGCRSAPPGLPQIQTTTQVAPGATYTRIGRGYMCPSDFWTVEVDVLDTNAEADALVARLKADGFDAYVHPFPTAPDDPTSGAKDYAVRSGHFSSQAQADSRRQRLLAAGYSHARTDYTSLDGSTTDGPWILNVLTIDPSSFHGRLEPHLASDIVPGKEQLTSIAARTGAIAGTNGGYFAVGPEDGTPGDLAGLSVVDGRLISEAVNGRTDFVVTKGPTVSACVAGLSTIDAIASSDSAERELDGLNRVPGPIRSCGGLGGDESTQNPLHDFTCTDSNEVIFYRLFVMKRGAVWASPRWQDTSDERRLSRCPTSSEESDGSSPPSSNATQSSWCAPPVGRSPRSPGSRGSTTLRWGTGCARTASTVASKTG
jgi:hypothetical protein